MTEDISISLQATQANDERTPWVRPELQRLDTSEARAGSPIGNFDGIDFIS